MVVENGVFPGAVHDVDQLLPDAVLEIAFPDEELPHQPFVALHPDDLLVFGERVRGGVDLGERETLADVSETIAEIFALEPFGFGKSFLGEILGL